jgi:hypothetical protein
MRQHWRSSDAFPSRLLLIIPNRLHIPDGLAEHPFQQPPNVAFLVERAHDQRTLHGLLFQSGGFDLAHTHRLVLRVPLAPGHAILTGLEIDFGQLITQFGTISQ